MIYPLNDTLKGFYRFLNEQETSNAAGMVLGGTDFILFLSGKSYSDETFRKFREGEPTREVKEEEKREISGRFCYGYGKGNGYILSGLSSSY